MGSLMAGGIFCCVIVIEVELFHLLLNFVVVLSIGLCEIETLRDEVDVVFFKGEADVQP
jgi:hypothetical protein